MLYVDDHAVAHDVDHFFAQNPGGQEIEDKFAPFVYHRVPGVVSALIAADDVEFFAEQIDHSSLAFVAPIDTANRCKHFLSPFALLFTAHGKHEKQSISDFHGSMPAFSLINHTPYYTSFFLLCQACGHTEKPFRQKLFFPVFVTPFCAVSRGVLFQPFRSRVFQALFLLLFVPFLGLFLFLVVYCDPLFPQKRFHFFIAEIIFVRLENDLSALVVYFYFFQIRRIANAKRRSRNSAPYFQGGKFFIAVCFFSLYRAYFRLIPEKSARPHLLL